MNIINNLYFFIGTVAGSIVAIWTLYLTVKSVTISSNKNDYEQWAHFINNRERIKKQDKISQDTLVNSITFLKKMSFSEVCNVADFSIENRIGLPELIRVIYWRNKGFIQFTDENGIIKLHLTSKSKNKFSFILSETARGFEKFSWTIFIAFHLYILYTLSFYNVKFDIIKSTEPFEINWILVIHIIILILTEVVMLLEIDIRKSIEEFLKKYN